MQLTICAVVFVGLLATSAILGWVQWHKPKEMPMEMECDRDRFDWQIPRVQYVISGVGGLLEGLLVMFNPELHTSGNYSDASTTGEFILELLGAIGIACLILMITCYIHGKISRFHRDHYYHLWWDGRI